MEHRDSGKKAPSIRDNVFPFLRDQHDSKNENVPLKSYTVPGLYTTPCGDRHFQGCMKARV